MQRVMRCLAAVACGFVGLAAEAEDVTLETAPPVVVKSVPEAGAADVDPRLSRIEVTFSKEMQDQSWSWATLSDESFPTTAGEPEYLDDRRTCVLPVKLEPGRTYALWINSSKFKNFKDLGGRSALPYLLVFRTRE